MNRVRFGLLLAVVYALVTNAGFAAENVDVAANSKMTTVFTFVRTYQGSCNSAPPPNFKIKKQAQNGRIVAEVVRTKFSATHKRCAGKPIQVFVVGYKPNKGFRGKDTASVSIRYNTYANVNVMASRTLKFNITVK